MASKKKSSGSSEGKSGAAKAPKAAKASKRKSTPPPEDLGLSSPEKNRKANTTAKMLDKKASKGDKDAEAALRRITASFEKRNRAKEALALARSEARKELGEGQEALRQSMEMSVEATAENVQLDEQLKRKLRRIESSWQELEETKAKHIEEVRDARGDLKRAEKLLEESVVEGRQLRLIA